MCNLNSEPIILEIKNFKIKKKSIYVDHVGRMTCDMASLADELSRRPMSRCQWRKSALERAEFRPVEGYLIDWLSDPCSGGNLFKDLLLEKKL